MTETARSSGPASRAAQLALLSPNRAAFELAWPGIIAGIWLGVLIDYVVRAGILMLRFRSGRWTRLRY